MLGDSFAFGDGVGDGETLGASLTQLSAGRVRSVNLGFPGYGPHQALAIVERGLEGPSVAQGPPVEFSVYWAAYDLQRAAGRSYWDENGPRYVAGPGGTLTYTGAFDGNRRHRLFQMLNRSRAFRAIVTPRLVDGADTALYVRILARIAELISSRYGCRSWFVLAGSEGDPTFAPTVESLRAHGLNVLTATELIPAATARQTDGEPRDDGHPDAEAQQRVAAALLERWEMGR